MPATKYFKINGVRKKYIAAGCHKSKGAAKAQAVAQRKRGKTARVLKSGKQYCVYTGTPSKKRRKK